MDLVAVDWFKDTKRMDHVAARRKRKQNQESSNEDGESKVIESTPADDVSHKKQRTGKAHIKVLLLPFLSFPYT